MLEASVLCVHGGEPQAIVISGALCYGMRHNHIMALACKTPSIYYYYYWVNATLSKISADTLTFLWD